MDPLAPPRQSQALGLFLSHFGVRPEAASPERLLGEVARGFSRIPYENLTKIVKHSVVGNAADSRRLPEEVLREHVGQGAGGTCFSLTACLLHVLRALGFEAEPILADRHYGADTHCALVVSVRGQPRILDPGFLVLDPVPLDRPARLRTAFNEVVLEPRQGGRLLDLYTVQRTRRTRRLTFKTAPVDPGEFARAWDASFAWDMMRYPLLTRVVQGSQLYLQDALFQIRTPERVERRDVDEGDLPRLVQARFGLRAELVSRALAVLRRQGENHGGLGSP